MHGDWGQMLTRLKMSCAIIWFEQPIASTSDDSREIKTQCDLYGAMGWSSISGRHFIMHLTIIAELIISALRRDLCGFYFISLTWSVRSLCIVWPTSSCLHRSLFRSDTEGNFLVTLMTKKDPQMFLCRIPRTCFKAFLLSLEAFAKLFLLQKFTVASLVSLLFSCFTTTFVILHILTTGGRQTLHLLLLQGSSPPGHMNICHAFPYLLAWTHFSISLILLLCGCQI